MLSKLNFPNIYRYASDQQMSVAKASRRGWWRNLEGILVQWSWQSRNWKMLTLLNKPIKFAEN
jgi:hypothetical protein